MSENELRIHNTITARLVDVGGVSMGVDDDGRITCIDWGEGTTMLEAAILALKAVVLPLKVDYDFDQFCVRVPTTTPAGFPGWTVMMVGDDDNGNTERLIERAKTLAKEVGGGSVPARRHLKAGDWHDVEREADDDH